MSDFPWPRDHKRQGRDGTREIRDFLRSTVWNGNAGSSGKFAAGCSRTGLALMMFQVYWSGLRFFPECGDPAAKSAVFARLTDRARRPRIDSRHSPTFHFCVTKFGLDRNISGATDITL